MLVAHDRENSSFARSRRPLLGCALGSAAIGPAFSIATGEAPREILPRSESSAERPPGPLSITERDRAERPPAARERDYHADSGRARSRREVLGVLRRATRSSSGMFA